MCKLVCILEQLLVDVVVIDIATAVAAAFILLADTKKGSS